MQNLIFNTQIPTILAVDDSHIMQEQIKHILSDCCRVLVSSNAKDALNLIYYEKISLLLLDIAMPQIDGIELCRTVRGMSQFRNLPIIMLSAKHKLIDKVKCRLAGATAYVTKPYDPDSLCELVNQFLYPAATTTSSRVATAKAGDGTRTHDVYLGKVTFYH
jgi:CheY-like chemotaxis protein